MSTRPGLLRWFTRDGARHDVFWYAECCVSHTSDAGVEMGIQDATVENYTDLLSPGIQRDALHSVMDRDICIDEGSGVGNSTTSKPSFSKPYGTRDVHGILKMLPFALKVYGLQHLCNNANASTHQTLLYWPTFFPILKKFELLLLSQEHRLRFRNTCVYGSKHHGEAWRFDKWSTQLYEERWKCVLAFLKKFTSVLHILDDCLDVVKFGNVDSNASKASDGGNAAMKPDTIINQEVEAPADDPDSRLGKRKLDLKGMRKALNDNFFHRFIVLAVGSEEVTEIKLAAWGEACICHRAFLQHCSDYYRRMVLEAQFGEGTRVCPAAGKVAPELAAGLLVQIMDCNVHSRTVHSVCYPVGNYHVYLDQLGPNQEANLPLLHVLRLYTSDRATACCQFCI